MSKKAQTFQMMDILNAKRSLMNAKSDEEQKEKLKRIFDNCCF